ncbi:MAG: D-tyrosyl-tRNA(Tyr) deacylase [Clostridia bacterium]|nr:D-tyrosyl-tRNA(Tyr) deacylase [Clostridia bacterium]MBQ4350970.1 D-tyrosyl-tRNA(Tyr) deacylase [Clostridia bacterium]
MLAMLQRIARGRVTSEGELLAECPGPGLLVLLGVTTEDEEEDALLLADKIAKLRIFSDEEGKMNRSVTDVGGGVIVVSQFTLCAAYRKGNRPDYLAAARPEKAIPLYEYFTALMRERVGEVSTGRFGADMQVEIVNDGPVTMQLDSNVLKQPKKGTPT